MSGETEKFCRGNGSSVFEDAELLLTFLQLASQIVEMKQKETFNITGIQPMSAV